MFKSHDFEHKIKLNHNFSNTYEQKNVDTQNMWTAFFG